MTVPADTQPPQWSEPPGGRPPRSGVENAVRWSLIGLLLLMVVGLSFGLGFGTHVLIDHTESTSPTSTAATKADGSPNFHVLDEIYQIMKDNYVDPSRIDPDLIRSGAINGVLNAIGDPFQVYVTKEQAEFDDDVNGLQGQYSGIGASVDQRNGEIVLVQPFEGSPAKAAGVRPGDVVLAIDGQSTKGFTVRDAQRKIRGPSGSSVKIQVRHPDGKIEDLTITRDDILLKSVIPDTPQDANGNPVDDIGYVRIEQFTRRTPDELKSYLQSIQGKGYKGLILDLRNDPGGLLDSVIAVASQFMKNQTVLIEQFRDGKEQRYTTRADGLATDPSLKMAVLVNHNSASASELLSGALRDNGRATVIGETTAGKGTVNSFFDLSDGGKVYVSIAHWLTPKRDMIEGKGIKPDIEVHVADNENPDPREYFNSVMYKAVDLLHGKS
jgi:carboxyl-terminal processing protease